ncbi:metastasis-suppressor KiSS-1 [Hemicordylus capensis]|uniref:metastasis-suppressor KiSS-1 n=1 Tax=Hemicordylus capensis TaxID=884348 RepID=UPI0023037294|nr:metastasis-suppressor KiSS-1 [Hemicordylus capensis]
MNLFDAMVLLLFFFRAQFGEPADSYFPLTGPWHEGESSKNFLKQTYWPNAILCPERRSSSGKAGLKSMPPVLRKRQEHQLQLWQGMHPVRSKVISVPQGALLEKREKNLSTYNWNSFGLRYGKRQATKAKLQ